MRRRMWRSPDRALAGAAPPLRVSNSLVNSLLVHHTTILLLTGSLHSGEAQADRQTLQKHTAAVKKLLDAALSHAHVCFSESAKDAKCLVDMCEVSNRDAGAVVAALVSKHCNRLADSIERLCGVVNNKCTYNSETNALVFAHGSGLHEVTRDSEAAPDDADEIFTEAPPKKADKSILKSKNILVTLFSVRLFLTFVLQTR